MTKPKKNELDLSKIPDYLSEKSKAIWKKVVEEYDIDITLYCYLESALKNLDEADRMTEIIDRDGLTITNKRSGAVKVHPLLSMRDKCYTQFGKFWNLMGLDLEPPGPTGRPAGR